MDKKRYKEEDFNSFIESLLKGRNFNDSKEEGIAKLAIDKGFDSLTDSQRYVFEQSIKPYLIEKCLRCEENIAWNEMLFAEDNGRLCSYCYHVSNKED